MDSIRACESVAGRWYWQTLAGMPVRFEHAWRTRVPEHWHTAGARTSPPSGYKSSRKAATPFHALINYAYAVLETEATIVLHAYGFDPGMGILHTDKRYRGSLAHDVMEPVRPIIDGLVIELLERHPIRRGDVYETREGVCRIGPPLARELSQMAPAVREPLQAQAQVIAALLLGETGVAEGAHRRSRAAAGKASKRRSTPRVRAGT
jgi:hypothetical protein